MLLRPGCAKRSDISDQFYINSIQTFLAILYVKLNFVAFFDLINQTTCVYKSFLVRIVMLNKTEAFFSIEKLNGALFFVHCKNNWY